MKENEPRQMRLVESEQMQHYDVVAPIVISHHVLAHEEKYREDQIQEARERIAFYSALAAAEAPKDE